MKMIITRERKKLLTSVFFCFSDYQKTQNFVFQWSSPLNKICNAMKETGLFWNPKKCKFFEISEGKHIIPENITLDNGTVIKSIMEYHNHTKMKLVFRKRSC